jgi:hypothetical protein
VPLLLVLAAVAVSVYRAVDLAAAPARRETTERRLLVGSFLAGFFLLFHVHVVHDAFQYYGYLVSAAIDGDLSLYDQIYLQNADRFFNPFPAQSARYVGTSILELPFFLAGHLVALVRHAAGNPVPAAGYGQVYAVALTLGSSLFGLVGMVATYRFAAALTSRRPAMIALLAVVFASPLVFFMYVWGGWAHPIGFALVALFLRTWQRGRPERPLGDWARLGLLAGAIALVRPTAVLVLCFPLFEWVAAVRAERRLARRRLAGPLLASVTAFMAFSPQLAVWKAISGHWIAAPYREVGDFHDWLDPHLGGLLFSAARHGLFVWTPLLLPALLGVALVYRSDRLVALAAGATAAATIYLYACWSIWWTGIGFSNRFFIELTPIFVLGLAALVQALARRRAAEWAVAALAVLVGLNLFLVGAYRGNDIPQGIPDPYRVVDEPLTVTGLAATALQVAPGGARPGWPEWAADGYFTSRVVRALTFGSARTWIVPLIIAVLVCGLAVPIVRVGLRERNAARRPPRAAGVVVATAVIVAGLHGAIGLAAAHTRPFPRFHRLPIGGVTVQQPAADSWIYSDYNRPVRSVDLVTHLIYGHGVEQGAAVASIILFDRDGRTYERVLRAGVDTAESSFARTEHRDAIRHRVDGTQPVRPRPNGLYSERDWESLSFRTTIDLPEPVVVTKVRLRYLHPVGRLVVVDVFLRES